MRTALAVVALCLLAVGSAVPAVAAADGGQSAVQASPTDDDNATRATAAPPGARLSGAMASQEARVSGSFEVAIVETDLATADSERARARRLARLEGDLDDRLDRLGAERRQLLDAFESSDVDAVTFRSRMSAIAARSSAVASLSERAGAEARTIDPAVREAVDLDPARLDAVARDGSALRADAGRFAVESVDGIPDDVLIARPEPGFDTDIDVEALLARTPPAPPDGALTDVPDEPTLPPTPEEPTFPEDYETPSSNFTVEDPDEDYTFATPEEFDEEYNFTVSDDGG